MCGRVGVIDDAQFIKEASKILKDMNIKHTLKPSYNIAPTQSLPTLTHDHVYLATEFGLIPHWAKDKKFRPINARAETLTEKPTFRTPFKRNRCIIPINGFYEWKKEGKHKIPYWIHPTQTDYFALAGLMDSWIDPTNGKEIYSSAIITTTPNETMKLIHDRMPVILSPKDWELWLDSSIQESEALTPLLIPSDHLKMDAYEVSTLVNSPANNTQACIEPKKNALF